MIKSIDIDEPELLPMEQLPHKEVILSFERFKDDKRIDYFFVFDSVTGNIERQEIETDLTGTQ